MEVLTYIKVIVIFESFVCGISLVAWSSHGSFVMCELYFSVDTAPLLKAIEYADGCDFAVTPL